MLTDALTDGICIGGSDRPDEWLTSNLTFSTFHGPRRYYVNLLFYSL